MELIGPAISGIGALTGLFGGGPSSNVQAPQMWQPPNMNGAANSMYGMIGQNANTFNPQYAGVGQSLMNNPGQGGAMQGAFNAQGYGNQAAGMANGGGNSLMQLASMLGPQAMQILNMGMDPQNAAYGRAQHNVTEQSRAGLEQRGLDSTPYGAGVENKANSDFNIDWQNNLLSRAVAAAGGASNLAGSSSSVMNTGANLMGMAPQLSQAAGMFPYTTFNQFGQDKFGALNQWQQGASQPISQYGSYLGMGNNAGSVANQNFGQRLGQANSTFGQQQQLGNQLGQSMNAFGRGGGFSPSTWGFGSGGGSSSMGMGYGNASGMY